MLILNIRGEIMFKKIFNIYNDLENITITIMHKGLFFCLILYLISGIILCTYLLNISSYIFYYIGITLFRISIIFAIEFILCGFIADSIKKEIY